METIIFNNEHLWIGNFGHFAVVLSFASALFSMLSYSLAVNQNNNDFLLWGKRFFYAHAVGVLAVFFALFYIIHQHYFEYQYAYQHSSTELPWYYMISCFWEGQEGSFLLWMFWHAVLGLILIHKAKDWHGPVLFVMALAQVILGSMLLGFHCGDIKIGSSPFELLRDHNPEALLIPVLEKLGKANYLEIYKEGNGLNPLLQNYWMVIHPPTLFFGFAATIVPFAFAFAGLWRNRLTEWMLPALPWALVAVMVLGTGIIMGGYWAYESLSFGGYWAWDPVENASLMPWLLLITATHMLLINKSTGKYPVLTMVLTMFSFFMVLYATFLTRSGILGNASVHSFTDLGLSGQLILLLFVFIFLTYAMSFAKRSMAIGFFVIGLLAILTVALLDWPISTSMQSTVGAIVLVGASVWFILNLYKRYNTKLETDQWHSREFWMFVGSMVLLLSGFQVIIMTSIPVFNKLFEGSKASAGEAYYNQVQIWFAIPVVLLTAIGQYFKYKQSDYRKVLESIANSLLIALVLAMGALFLFNIWSLSFMLLIVASCYAVVGNIHYIWTSLKGRIKVSGASIAHIGFGLMMLGVVVSSVNKTVLSLNQSGTGFFSETNEQGQVDEQAKKGNKENVLLAKNRPVQFANNALRATFKSVREAKPNKYFKVDYEVLNSKGEVTDAFTLEPNTQNNPKMGMVSNPDTRHYLTRDIFTHVTFESSMEQQKDQSFSQFRTDTVSLGQTFATADGSRQLSVQKINVMQPEAAQQSNPTLHLQAEVLINSLGDTFWAKPEFISADQIRFKESIVDAAGVIVIFDRVIPDPKDPKNMLFVISSGTRKPKMDYIILKAIEFPYINLLWLGTLVLLFGFMLSIIQRFKELKRRQQNAID